MISKALLKRDIKVSYKLWLVITAVMLLLLFALFFATSGSEGGIMIIQQFYSLFAALIPVFYIGAASNKLIASWVDNGSFSYVMSAPLKRRTVFTTQGLFLILSVAAMYMLFFITGLVAFAVWGQFMDTSTFFMLNLGSFLLNMVISGIAYFATCCFNSAGAATSIGTGLPLAFFLLYVVSAFFGSNKLLGYCKYLTINSLYNPSGIIAGNSEMIWQFLLMFGMAAVLFLAGAVVFKKKDLPL